MPSGSNRRGLEIVEHGLAGRLLDDGREHVGRRGVVEEMRARLERDRLGQEGLGPGLVGRPRRLGLMAGGHAEQVADAHRLEVVARLGRGIVGEELQHLVVEAQFPLGDGQPHGRGGEALAQRVKRVRRLGVVRRPPALGHDVAVAHEHEAVHRVDGLVGRLDERRGRPRTRRPVTPDCCAAGLPRRPGSRSGQRVRRRGESSCSGPGRSCDGGFVGGLIFPDPVTVRNRRSAVAPSPACPGARPPYARTVARITRALGELIRHESTWLFAGGRCFGLRVPRRAAPRPRPGVHAAERDAEHRRDRHRRPGRRASSATWPPRTSSPSATSTRTRRRTPSRRSRRPSSSATIAFSWTSGRTSTR